MSSVKSSVKCPALSAKCRFTNCRFYDLSFYELSLLRTVVFIDVPKANKGNSKRQIHDMKANIANKKGAKIFAKVFKQEK